MPYLRIAIGRNKSEAEAQAALHYLRDNFPLQQSAGSFHRMSSNYILFEQPEHTVLTLEQALWMERHGYNPMFCTRFYSGQDQGCTDCCRPFDDAPTGYCPHCYTADPYRVTALPLQFSAEEFRYLQYVARRLWVNGTESTYIRDTALTLMNVIERKEPVKASILDTDRFAKLVEEFTEEQVKCCHYCHLPANQCTCSGFHHDDPQQISVPFTRQEYQHIQALADSYKVDVETFVRRSLGIPEVQICMASAGAAAGHIFRHRMDFYLSRFTETVSRLTLADTSTTQSVHNAGNSFWLNYHLTNICTDLAEEVPLLAAVITKLLLDLPQELSEKERVVQIRTQLEQIDSTAVQDARGCTEYETQALEQKIGRMLPEAYKEFLIWMGYGAGSFMCYLDCLYPSLATLQRTAVDLLLTDACTEILPEDAFVFYMQRDQHFAFFCTSEGDDPPIYTHKRHWRRSPFRKVYHHFSDFLAVQLGLYDSYQRKGGFQPQSYQTRKLRFSAMGRQVEVALARKRKTQQGDIQ